MFGQTLNVCQTFQNPFQCLAKHLFFEMFTQTFQKPLNICQHFKESFKCLAKHLNILLNLWPNIFKFF